MVLWKHHKVAEAIWELESEMHEKYLVLFLSGKQFRGWNSFWGRGECRDRTFILLL